MIEAGNTYVALGSSFAAGPGIEPIVDVGAARSGRNYAHLVAEAMSLKLVDVTCSGATTDDILSTRQRTRSGHVPPQIDAVTADARLVTITCGGNDMGYIGALIRGSLLGVLSRILPRGPADRLLDRVDYGGSVRQCAEVADSLVAVVDAVRAKAPQAQVVLVDYLTVLGTDAHPGADLPLRQADIRRGTATADGLAAAFAQAAKMSGAGLVVASAAGVSHGVGSAEPWMNGFRLRRLRRSAPYHPTPAGMSAVADLVLTLLRDQRTT
jgi:lysophospholipase L1-like esterase